MDVLTNESYLSPWIEDLPFTWETFQQLGQKMLLKKHEYLFHQDQPTDHVYIVVEGRIRLFITSPSGDEKAIVIIGKNGLIGECGIFNIPSYNSSAITASNASVIKVPKHSFETAMKDDYHITKQILIIMDMKNRILASHTMMLSSYSAVQRICYTLLQLVHTYGKKTKMGDVIDLRFTHQELANLVGTSRVTVANTMKMLEKEQILAKVDSKYVITDVKQLEKWVITSF